jgi:hypothetical protein
VRIVKEATNWATVYDLALRLISADRSVIIKEADIFVAPDCEANRKRRYVSLRFKPNEELAVSTPEHQISIFTKLSAI